MIEIALFPTQTETDGLFVIVGTQTGVQYSNQCGGTACQQQGAEGFLVPVGTPQDLSDLKGWFRRRFGDSCWCDGRLAVDSTLVQELATLIAGVPCWAGERALCLQLDTDRLHL